MSTAIKMGAARVFFLFALIGSAATPAFSYDYLHRADARGPNFIFERGFVAPGDNRNLLHHMEGLSCGNDNVRTGVGFTNYVELNDRVGVNVVIRARLQVMRQTDANPIVWRYDILPSPNDYDVAHTFAQRINAAANLNLNTGRVAAAHMRAAAQQTWVATAAIAPNRIMAAHAFVLNGNTVVELPNMLRLNPAYVDRPVVRNESPLPLATIVDGAAEPILRRLVVNNTRALLSACACASLRSANRSTELADDNLCRDNISPVQASDDNSYIQIKTPGGLDPKEYDDGSDLR
ncbi:hypothetical protein ACSFA3_15415 [Variovorax sp. RHLX14]